MLLPMPEPAMSARSIELWASFTSLEFVRIDQIFLVKPMIASFICFKLGTYNIKTVVTVSQTLTSISITTPPVVP